MAFGNTIISITHPQDDVAVPAGTEAGRITNALAVALEKFAGGGMRGTSGVDVTTGGVFATGTVTLVNSTGVRASGTITYSTASGTTTATVNGVAFSQTTGTDAVRAAALAAAITSSSDPLIVGVVTASVLLGVVTVTAYAKGTAGNALTLAVTGTGVARSAATLAGGTNNTVTVTINGVGVATNVTTQLSDTTAAAAVAASINSPAVSSVVSGVVRASSSGNVVTVRSLSASAAANAITLAATGTGATASGANLTGGVNGVTVSLVR